MNSLYHDKYLKYKSKYLALKNSYKMVGGGDKPKVIFFKLEGCGPCIGFTPVWEALTNDNKLKSKVTFESLETKREIPDLHVDKTRNKYQVSSFPSIVFENTGEHFKGNRDVKTLTAWINEQLNKKT
jgi:hypothetical protein